MKKIKGKYHCRHCGKIVNRISNKQWIKSFCEKTDKWTRLTLLIKEPDNMKKTKKINLDPKNYKNNIVSNRERFRVIQEKINEIIDRIELPNKHKAND